MTPKNEITKKSVVIKAILLVMAFAITIFAIRMIRQVGDVGDGEAGPKNFTWCESTVEYVRLATAPQKLELTEDEITQLCTLDIQGYKPSEVDNSSFEPLLLVRFENGGQQVIEGDSAGHFRMGDVIFKSDDLSDWLEAHQG